MRKWTEMRTPKFNRLERRTPFGFLVFTYLLEEIAISTLDQVLSKKLCDTTTTYKHIFQKFFILS